MLLQLAAMAAWKTFQTGDRVPSELLNIRNFERANNQDFAKKPVDKSKTNKTLNFGNDGYPKIKSSISDIVDDKDKEAIYRNSRQPPGQSYNAFMGATSHQTMN